MSPDHISELFAAFGPVTPRRMFSGTGIFADGMMFALVIDDVIYLKADASTIPDFEREGMAAFSYATRDGRRTVMSYWRLPERLYDDADELARWAQWALETARRSAAKARPAKARGARRGVKRPGSR